MTRTEIRYLEGSRVKATLPEGAAQPRIEVEEELSILAGRIRKVFPFSNAESYYSIQDGAGKELGVLRDMEELDKATREIFENELARRYFTPTILSIESLRQDGGMWLFKVQTQRGPAEFYVRNWRDSSHEISHLRFQIVSVDGQRFEIRDLNTLDARSQALLDQLF